MSQTRDCPNNEQSSEYPLSEVSGCFGLAYTRIFPNPLTQPLTQIMVGAHILTTSTFRSSLSSDAGPKARHRIG